jgi:hypothetical protein
MEDSNQSLEEQQARLDTFKKRPLLGVWLLLLGIGIPGLTALLLALFASEIFFSSFSGKLTFSAIVAVSAGISVVLVQRLRSSAIRKHR